VLFYHASILWHVPGDSWLIRFGWMGVDLFFALSGFLIGGQLLRPRARGAAPSYSHFMVRRLLRTVPAYLVILTIYFLVPWLRDGTEMKPLWQFLTFTQNLAGDLTPSVTFSPAWSLCVEEQFYLAFPLVVAVLAIRPSTTVIAATILAVLLFGIGIRGYLWTHDVAMTVDGRTLLSGDRFMSLIYYPTWSRLDALLAGVVAATVQTFRPKWWRVLTARSNLLALCGVTGVALSIGFFGDQLATLLPTVFGYLGSANIGAFPVSLIIAAAIFAVAGLFLRYHRIGRAIYAIGGNREAARAAGIKVDRVRIGVYVAGSVLAAIGGLMEAGRVSSVAPTQGYGEGIIFSVFAAAVIGGVSLQGGKGNMVGAASGVILLGIVSDILDLAQVSNYWIEAIDGAVILFALVLARIVGGESTAEER